MSVMQLPSPGPSDRSVVGPAPAPPRLSVLGRFRLELEGEPVELPVPAARLIGLLAVSAGGTGSRLTVASALWMDVPDARAAGNLRHTLWRLGSLAQTCLQVDPRTVALAPDVDVDMHHLVGQCGRLLDPVARPVPSDLDCSTLTADLLPGWDEEWLAYERERLRQLRMHALEAASRRLSDLGRHGKAIDAGQVAVAAEPLRESAHRTLIEAHLAEGNIVEAWRQYDRCAALLRSELGVGPSRALQDLLVTDHDRRATGPGMTRR